MEQEDKILRELIQENNQEVGPSMRFTADIMDTIAAKQAIKSKPLIGVRAWFLLALGFMGILITAIALTPSQITTPKWFPKLAEISFSSNLITPLLIGLITCVFFIVLDEIWRRRKKAPQSS